jgi:hypothetical protein
LASFVVFVLQVRCQGKSREVLKSDGRMRMTMMTMISVEATMRQE